MDPRKFRAPVQCNLCSLLFYTLTDVSRHCSYHTTVDLICHHCLTNFDSKAAIVAHLNQKGAHLRLPYDSRTYDSAMPSPIPSTSAVLPLSQPAPLPVPTSPIPAVSTLSDVSLDQLLRDIDTSTLPGTDASAASISPQAASSHPSSSDVSPTVGVRPKTSVSCPPSEYRQLRQQNTEYKFLLWWCLHHLKSLPTPPSSAGGELDLSLRRVLQQTAMAPQFDENSSFEDVVEKFYNLHVQNVTKFP